MKIVDMDYGVCFHIYLRKMSDTDWSSLLWNMIHVLSSEGTVWVHFCAWCDQHWKENPAMPFYDVAIEWAKLTDIPDKYEGRMFRQAILLCDETTRDDLNDGATYDLNR